jgi:predicted ATP-grasp superfamily ATP-dependent carboligase
MVLDGDNDNAIQIATELSTDLDAEVIGVGTSEWSRLLRSRHCNVGVTTAPASDPAYAEQLLDAVYHHEPDLLVPVGYHSVAAADRIRDRLPESVACWLPPADSLDVVLDKVATASRAADLDVETPETFTETVADLDRRGRPGEIATLPFPLFCKARHECGTNLIAKVEEPSAFWETYDDLREEIDDTAGGVAGERTDGAGRTAGEVIVQECIPGERTYGCGLLYENGDPQLLFAHEELRSIPREGGRGTRVQIFRDPRLETAAIRLLDGLDWHGPALVEFKRRPDGTYVLMEINPKLWASYALASQAGYRFVSTCAARAMDLHADFATAAPDATAEMVFPLRELYYAARTDDESLLGSVAALCWPPAQFDVNLADVRAWLTPPAAVVDAVSSSSQASRPPPTSGDAFTRGEERTNGETPPGGADSGPGDASTWR